MSTLQNVRDRVRTQLDLDVEDLPDAVLDTFIREGFDRTFAIEQEWPFFETTWNLIQVAGATTLTLPSDVAYISSLRNAVANRRLLQVAQRVAEDNFEGVLTAGEPELFSTWGSTLALWPPPTEVERTFTMRGFRKPLWTGVDTDELDGDDRLHGPISHFATSLAYAQLEDPELEDVYMRRWASSLQAIRDELMRPQTHEPMVLNGGLTGYAGRRRRPGSVWLEV